MAIRSYGLNSFHFFPHISSSVLTEIHVILRYKGRLLLPLASSALATKPFPEMRLATHPQRCLHFLGGTSTAADITVLQPQTTRAHSMGMEAPDPEEVMRKGAGLATAGIMGPAMNRDHKYLDSKGCLERHPRRTHGCAQ